MNLLDKLLPTVREIRTPLAAGYAWLFAMWLIVADLVPRSVDENEHGSIADAVARGWAALSSIGQAVAISFAAYLTGSLVGFVFEAARRTPDERVLVDAAQQALAEYRLRVQLALPVTVAVLALTWRGIRESGPLGLLWLVGLTVPCLLVWHGNRLLRQAISVLPRTDLKKAELPEAYLAGLRLVRADLSGANLWHADLRHAGLTESNLSGATLIEADLSGANLSGANLGGADLSKATLKDSNLSAANLSNSTLTDSELSRANMASADLSRANLSGADLRGATLNGAILTDAQLVYANLSGATLAGAHLRGAILDSATLDGADLAGSSLDGANVAGAIWNDQTKWPWGYTPPASAK